MGLRERPFFAKAASSTKLGDDEKEELRRCLCLLRINGDAGATAAWTLYTAVLGGVTFFTEFSLLVDVAIVRSGDELGLCGDPRDNDRLRRRAARPDSLVAGGGLLASPSQLVYNGVFCTSFLRLSPGTTNALGSSGGLTSFFVTSFFIDDDLDRLALRAALPANAVRSGNVDFAYVISSSSSPLCVACNVRV